MQIRTAFQFLFWEGAFAMAFETWIGPTYLSGVAGELGVSVALLSLMTAVPAIGAIGQVFSLWAYQRSPSVKTYVLRLATLARTLWAVPVFFAWAWGLQSYWRSEPFPARQWFLVSSGAACLAALVGSSSGVAWMSWVREIVPTGFRGRFFGVRQRFVMGGVILAHLMGYLWIGCKPGGYHLGYGLLLLGALVCAVASTVLLARVPDVASEKLTAPFSWSDLREPFQDGRFRALLIFGALFNGAIQLAGPYFPYYFTHELKISLSTISLWTLLTNLGLFLAAVGWGRRIDRKRRLTTPFWFALHMIALSPAFYIFGDAHWVSRMGPIDFFFNGVFWAGYNLYFTTLLLEACPQGRCALYYSVYSGSAGLAGALGNLLGGQLAILLQPIGGFRALWMVAVVARLSIVWALYPLLIRGSRPIQRLQQREVSTIEQPSLGLSSVGSASSSQ